MKKLLSILLIMVIITGSISSVGANELPTVLPVEIATADNFEPSLPTGDLNLIEPEGMNNKKLSRMLTSSDIDYNELEQYLRSQILAHKSNINVSTFNIPSSKFSDIFFAFVFTNNDLPIRTAYYQPTLTESGTVKTFTPGYLYSTKTISDIKREKLLNLVDSLAEYADIGKDDFEKTLLLFDKISLDYYYTPITPFEEINYTPYSFLEKGHAVCQGYAMLYKLTLNKLGIESYVCANYDKSVEHAWNYVKIDGQWYHSDPTWSYYSNKDNMVFRKYFLMSDEAMISDAKHGIPSDWVAERKNFEPIDCLSNKYSSGYLFHEFTGVPIYRDEKSLYFDCTIHTQQSEYELTFRSNSLELPAAILSEPEYDNGRHLVYFLTLKDINSDFSLAVSGYDTSGKYTDCKIFTLPGLPQKKFTPAYTYGLENKSDKIKWTFFDSKTLSPLTFSSELTFNEE